MGYSTASLNRSCVPYPEAFSASKSADSIKTYAFERVKRGPAKKCHDTSLWLQKGSRSPIIHEGESPDVMGQRTKLTREKVTHYSTPEGIVELNKEGIAIALDRRVALFFQQSILCFGMSDFTFSASGADDQIGTSPSIALSGPGKRITHKREAAHSSTIPTLIAHANDGSTPNGFVYLKGGSSHDQHNGTIGMHNFINGADELIDGRGLDNKLRHTAVKILNRVAQGLDPVKATQEFILALGRQVILAKQFLREKQTGPQPDGRLVVLEQYSREISEISVASRDKTFFDQLIGVVIDPEDKKEAVLRQVIYKKRYDVIRLQEVVDSRIGKRIEATANLIEKGGKSFLEYILLKSFSETQERKILEKLFCKTAVIFETEFENAQKTDGTDLLKKKEKSSLKAFRTRVRNLHEKYKNLIENLKRDLRADFRELSSAEFSYRADVFKDLRTKVNNWTQKAFCEHYQDVNETTVSKSWVSRMEQLSRLNTRDNYKTPVNQRRRYVSLTDAKNCAKTFGVDNGVFLPCLFSSTN